MYKIIPTTVSEISIAYLDISVDCTWLAWISHTTASCHLARRHCHPAEWDTFSSHSQRWSGCPRAFAVLFPSLYMLSESPHCCLPSAFSRGGCLSPTQVTLVCWWHGDLTLHGHVLVMLMPHGLSPSLLSPCCHPDLSHPPLWVPLDLSIPEYVDHSSKKMASTDFPPCLWPSFPVHLYPYYPPCHSMFSISSKSGIQASPTPTIASEFLSSPFIYPIPALPIFCSPVLL